MVADFEFIGNIGKITIPDNNGKKKCVFLTLAVRTQYQKKTYTIWYNNFVAFGNMAELIQKRLMPGNLVLLKGTISVYKPSRGTNRNERNSFIITKYELLRKTEEQLESELNQREDNDLKEEDFYPDPEPEDLQY